MRVVSEGPVKITKATVEAAWKHRAQKQRLVIRDAECRGLALVVNPSGMSWVFSYKPRGRDPGTGKRWPSASVTIGTPESHSPDSARDEAGKAKGAVKSGGDPSAERKAAAQARTSKQARTVARMLDLLETAAARDCDLVVYPELALTTFFPRWYMTDPSEVDAWFEREMPNAAQAVVVSSNRNASRPFTAPSSAIPDPAGCWPRGDRRPAAEP